MPRSWRKTVAWTFAGAVLWGLGLAPIQYAGAQESLIPTPRSVIYPGDVIRDEMLAEIPAEASDAVAAVALTRSELVGKMSRRTLLPGRPVPLGAIDNPRVISNGAEVRLIYRDGGLCIVATGAAMQDGGVGDVIRIRNSDSGVTVSGTVQPDGTVQVSGG